MRRKSKTRYMKYVFLGYVLVAVGVIGFGWTSRPEPEPFSNIPVMPGSIMIAVPGNVALMPIGAHDMPEAVAEMRPASEGLVETVALSEDPEELDDDDLRLPGDPEQDVTQFEEVEPNPYLVTD